MDYKPLSANGITQIDSSGSMDIHSTGVKGNDAALIDFVRYSVWRKINTAKQFSERKRLRLFRTFDKMLSVKIVREGLSNGQ